MNLETAIRTALTFEKNVKQMYADAQTTTRDEAGRRFFQVMTDEEDGHIRYLDARLAEWLKNGRISSQQLASAIPPAARIQAATANLTGKLAATDREADIARLKQAVILEQETSDFYQRAVAELPAADARLFDRFLEIENGHRTIVQAELDGLTGTGFWFDVREFDLEAG